MVIQLNLYIVMIDYVINVVILREAIMKINTINRNSIEIAVVESSDIVIKDVQSALDFMATIKYETNCDRIAINKSAICEDFFQLRTKLAGEVLQKFINYHVKLAIVGDFSSYTSKSLRDFMYECNQGKDIFFLSNEDEAIEKLTLG